MDTFLQILLVSEETSEVSEVSAEKFLMKINEGTLYLFVALY